MKKIIIGLIILLLIVLLIVGGLIIMKIIKDKGNKKLELTYEINAGIPFKWEFEIEDKSIVEFEKSYVIRNDNKNGLVGGAIYTNYVFKGKKEGKTKIIFRKVSITDDNYPAHEEINNVRVDKDLNISLVAYEE